jgi:ribose 5-phosphate isomerase B
MLNEILIGCDNAAVRYKEIIIKHLESLGVRVENVGCDTADDPTFYPVVAKRLCDRIAESGYTKKGILICGTGIGMAMTANKCKGIRAAVCHDIFSTRRSVLSNDANVMCFGERVIGIELAKALVSEWITLAYIDGNSTPKIEAIDRIEKENFK